MLVLLAAVLIAAAIVIGAVFWSRLPRRRHTDPGNSATPVSVASAVPGQTGAQAGGGEAAEAEQAEAEDPNAIRPLTGHEIFTKLCEYALGRGRGTELAAGHEGIAEAAAAALLDAATQQRYTPRRPNMLPRLLSAANDENVSRRELTSIIAKDPSLVGNLLKIANSSFYRITPEPVESVDRAVALLGTDGIRSLITAAVMQPIFRFGGADFPRFPEVAWEHTFRSASAAVPYTFFVEKADPFTAELLSLVMGLAGIVVFRVAMDQYAGSPRMVPHASVIAWLLDNHCAPTARRIGASWELSEKTLASLDDQTWTATEHPTALGRSLYYGRLVGALAVLRTNRVINEDTALASIPRTEMPQGQVMRMWMRLTPQPGKAQPAKP